MTHEKIETCSSPCHGLLLRYVLNGLRQSNPFGIRKHPALQYGGGHRGKSSDLCHWSGNHKSFYPLHEQLPVLHIQVGV